MTMNKVRIKRLRAEHQSMVRNLSRRRRLRFLTTFRPNRSAAIPSDSTIRDPMPACANH